MKRKDGENKWQTPNMYSNELGMYVTIDLVIMTVGSIVGRTFFPHLV